MRDTNDETKCMFGYVTKSTIKGIRNIFKICSKLTKVTDGPYGRWYGVFKINLNKFTMFSIFITTLKPFYM